MAWKSLRAIRRRWAASLGPFIEDDAFAHGTAHSVVERIAPVIELLRTIKQEVLGAGEFAQGHPDALQFAPT